MSSRERLMITASVHPAAARRASGEICATPADGQCVIDGATMNAMVACAPPGVGGCFRSNLRRDLLYPSRRRRARASARFARAPGAVPLGHKLAVRGSGGAWRRTVKRERPLVH